MDGCEAGKLQVHVGAGPRLLLPTDNNVDKESIPVTLCNLQNEEQDTEFLSRDTNIIGALPFRNMLLQLLSFRRACRRSHS